MSAATAPSPSQAPSPPSGFGPARVLAIVAGSIVSLIALAFVLAGLSLMLAHVVARDGDGYFNSATRTLSTSTFALTAEKLQLGDLRAGAGDWAVEELAGRVRVRAALVGGAPVFVGIARERDLDAYLAGVAHDRVMDGGANPRYERSPGTRALAAPGSQRFWVASAAGPGEQTAEWKVRGGRWAAVVMRADAARDVAADVRVGIKVGWVLALGAGLLTAGLLIAAGGAALLWAGLHRPGPPESGSPQGEAPAPVT
jgi:hypothetical protein